MRVLLLLMLYMPLRLLAVDNTLVNSEIGELTLQDMPIIGMAFSPGVEPGVVISLPDNLSTVIPGYQVKHDDVAYVVGISCKADLSDDCSSYYYGEDYQLRSVYTRYIQTSDTAFKTPEGSTIGDSWEQTISKAGGDNIVYSGNDSCVLLRSGWRACIDLMSIQREFDMKARRLVPQKSATIDFYYRQ